MNKNKVIVVWGYDPELSAFHTLSFNSGESRVYERDNLPRVLGELPFCATLAEAQKETEGKGGDKSVQLDYTAAAEAGLL